MKLHDKHLLMTDDHFKWIVEMAIREHIVGLIMNPATAVEEKAMAQRIFYQESGYSVAAVASLACEVIAGGAEIVFITKDRETIIEELLAGGEAEQQLKYAIATNFLLWKKPEVALEVSP